MPAWSRSTPACRSSAAWCSATRSSATRSLAPATRPARATSGDARRRDDEARENKTTGETGRGRRQGAGREKRGARRGRKNVRRRGRKNARTREVEEDGRDFRLGEAFDTVAGEQRGHDPARFLPPHTPRLQHGQVHGRV